MTDVRQQFKVAAVSDNTNSFGLYNHVFIAQDGTALSAAGNATCKRRHKVGSSVQLDPKAPRTGLTALGFEIPERLPPAPPEAVEAVWGPPPKPPKITVSELRKQLAEVTTQRDAAIKLLAEWGHAVDTVGSGWDDWDHYYKNAMYRPGPLRELIDAAVETVRAERADS